MLQGLSLYFPLVLPRFSPTTLSSLRTASLYIHFPTAPTLLQAVSKIFQFATSSSLKMQLFTLLPLLLSTLAVSSPLAKRAYTPAKVLGDFESLTRNVDHLTTNLASFVRSPSVGIKTFSDHFYEFNVHITVATADTLVVGSFNTTVSPSIATAAYSWSQYTLTFLIALMNNVNPHLPLVRLGEK